jgi:hypothetical protein
MDFKTYFFGLSVQEREVFAGRVGSTRGTLTQVAYGNKEVDLGFADVICAQSRGEVSLDDLPLTDRARMQRKLRHQCAA